MGKSKLELLRKHYDNKSFRTKDAHKLGVSSRMLSFYVGTGELERVGHGLYVFPDFDVEKDFKFYDLALVAKSIKGAVICLVSALSYWDITDEIPREYWLAIPNNYPLPKSNKKVRFIRPRDHKTGIIEKEIAGQKVKITTPERSVCDAFKYLDEETSVTSLREYLRQDRDAVKVGELLDIAHVLKSNKVIEIMTEVASASGKAYPSIDREIFHEIAKWLMNNSRRRR